MSNKRKPYTDKIMRILTRQARVITGTQASRILPEAHIAISSLRCLLRQEMIDAASLPVAYPKVEKPILRCNGSQGTPNHEHIRWVLEKRWAKLIPKIETVYWATEKGQQFHGGVAKPLKHTGQLEHDLGTAEVLTIAYENRSKWIHDWIGEDLLKQKYPELVKRLRVLPDAVTLDKKGNIYKAIELGGQYSVKRLRQLHESFARQKIRYEIW